MPGMLCDGSDLKTADVRDSKAYCEGVNRTPPVNPHEPGSDAHAAYDAGAVAAQGAAPGDVIGCCAALGESIAVPDVVDLAEAEAIAAIEGAGLVAVHGEGDTDPVVDQDPAAGTLVVPNSTVTYDTVVTQ